MAKIIRRVWKTTGPLGERIKHVAFGYTLMVNGTRERKWSSEWSEADALRALTERKQDIRARRMEKRQDVQFKQLTERYLQFKRDHGKRSIQEDERMIGKQLLPLFGEHLPIRQVTSDKIATFGEKRIKEVSVSTVRNELACLRHLPGSPRRNGAISIMFRTSTCRRRRKAGRDF